MQYNFQHILIRRFIKLFLTRTIEYTKLSIKLAHFDYIPYLQKYN